MSSSPMPTQQKTFTVQQANATLPLVRAIVSDLVELARDVIERRRRLSVLTSGRRHQRTDLYHDELAHAEAELSLDSRRLQEYVDELAALGVELKSATEGLIDFPAVLDGRVVYLCWKLGEAEVGYWHDVDVGFQGRQPLSTTSLGGG